VTHLDPGFQYQWVVIHKGLLNEISHEFIRNSFNKLTAVFANEVFVVFSSRQDLARVSSDSPHVLSLMEKVGNLQQGNAAPASRNNTGLQPYLNYPSENIPFHIEAEAIVQFSSLSLPELRQRMNTFYSRGGYEFPHLWDQIRNAEIDKAAAALLSPTADQKILDVGCGTGRSAGIIADCSEFWGIDLSDVAIDKARHQYADKSDFHFLPMDAHHLQFEDNTFDIVLSLETYEHVFNPHKVIREIFRVLKPSGRLILNAANRDSLHIRMIKKLGYPELKTNYQHINETTLHHLRTYLEQVGFIIREVRSLFLLPYWGVPGVDEHVRHITDNDEEIVEALRYLGEKAGPDYAYSFLIACTKTSL
jgi:ubiquinone/menaquinone biosynthesis C-methylase UbiE